MMLPLPLLHLYCSSLSIYCIVLPTAALQLQLLRETTKNTCPFIDRQVSWASSQSLKLYRLLLRVVLLKPLRCCSFALHKPACIVLLKSHQPPLRCAATLLLHLHCAAPFNLQLRLCSIRDSLLHLSRYCLKAPVARM